MFNSNHNYCYEFIDKFLKLENNLIEDICMNNLVSPLITSGNHPWQTTISKSKSFNGIGLHSGSLIKVTLKPGKENTGIIFIRTDIDKKIKERSIRALYSNVSDTSLCTTIENE